MRYKVSSTLVSYFYEVEVEVRGILSNACKLRRRSKKKNGTVSFVAEGFVEKTVDSFEKKMRRFVPEM